MRHYYTHPAAEHSPKRPAQTVAQPQHPPPHHPAIFYCFGLPGLFNKESSSLSPDWSLASLHRSRCCCWYMCQYTPPCCCSGIINWIHTTTKIGRDTCHSCMPVCAIREFQVHCQGRACAEVCPQQQQIITIIHSIVL